MKKILITPKSFHQYSEEALKNIRLEGYEIIENHSGKTLSEEEIIAASKEEVEGIIVGVDSLSRNVLEQLPKLKAISKYGVGVDNIDLKFAESVGIKVKNAVGTNAISVAEHAIALIFESAKNLSSSIREVKNGSWNRKLGMEITNKNLLVIGGGQIGKEVAKRAIGLQMKVTIYDPFFNDSDFLTTYGIQYIENLSTQIGDFDFITLHLPVNEFTKNLVNKDLIAKMKNSAAIINTARGELVNEQDIFEALETKQLRFVAQDVYSSEPPKENDRLIQLESFVLTPHLAAYTEDSVKRMVSTSTKNLIDMLKVK